MAVSTIPFALAAALLGQAAAAAEPEPAAPPKIVEGVTVQAPDKPLDGRVREFVGGALGHRLDGSIVRWRDPICPLVSGLPGPMGEAILVRLSEVARRVEAPLAGPDCRPNLYVMVHRQPRALLEGWRRRDGRLFGEASPEAVRRIIESDQPVRAWHNWRYEEPGLPRASRLVRNVVRNTTSAIVVVDARRLDGVTVAQLADYVAMVGLVEMQPDIETRRAATILALFEEAREPPPGLTRWDEALLHGAYSTPQENVLQRSAIARKVLREASREEPPEEAPP
ncbi:hypothetical protein [Phenylobacterium sp.]|uniref:hypothetical protein n=1 Tax=Phenylobacterium sp. TaxID=1871053 RepID=UPI002CD6B137|nr:hypothetical protein [Phenylobacterium sp.]HVI34473.1 hypothetical protein [Phenylobacterium sp.]